MSEWYKKYLDWWQRYINSKFKGIIFYKASGVYL